MQERQTTGRKDRAGYVDLQHGLSRDQNLLSSEKRYLTTHSGHLVSELNSFSRKQIRNEQTGANSSFD